MVASELRDIKDPSLIDQAVRTSIVMLQKEVDKGKNIPMSEFTKILIWAKQQKEKIYNEELEKDKLVGWKVEKRTWCGVLFHEFQIPSLGIRQQF